jgi:subtilisin family serine protease
MKKKISLFSQSSKKTILSLLSAICLFNTHSAFAQNQPIQPARKWVVLLQNPRTENQSNTQTKSLTIPIAESIRLTKTELQEKANTLLHKVQQNMSTAKITTASSSPTVGAIYDALDSFEAVMTDQQAKILKEQEGVLMVAPMPVVEMKVLPSITTQTTSWALDRIDQKYMPLDNQYIYETSGRGVHIYVIDSGIRSDHSDFTGRISTGWDLVENDNTPQDCRGHGTVVASLAAGARFGVAKNAWIHPVRIFNCSDPSYLAVAAINWVLKNHQKPAVVNMSIGGAYDQALNTYVKALVNAGITVVVAAGNESKDACTTSPASESSAITVGATTAFDMLASFSNYGSCVDLFAPGDFVQGASITGDTNSLIYASGTSIASPLVAGAAAIYLEQNPNASPESVTGNLKLRASIDVLKEIKGSPNLLLSTLGIHELPKYSINRRIFSYITAEQPSCPEGTEQEGNICYEPCRYAGYYPQGDYCYTKCPSDKNADGLDSVDSGNKCTQVVRHY